MASALSLTMCSISSTSVLVTDRIASMLLMSSRPMIASLLECVTVMMLSWVFVSSVDRVGGCEHGDHRSQEGPGGLLVAEVELLARGEEVRDREPCQHVDQALGGIVRDVQRDGGGERDGGHADDARQPVDG